MCPVLVHSGLFRLALAFARMRSAQEIFKARIGHTLVEHRLFARWEALITGDACKQFGFTGYLRHNESKPNRLE
jgi:hypothetical protein